LPQTAILASCLSIQQRGPATLVRVVHQKEKLEETVQGDESTRILRGLARVSARFTEAAKVYHRADFRNVKYRQGWLKMRYSSCRPQT